MDSSIDRFHEPIKKKIKLYDRYKMYLVLILEHNNAPSK